LTASSPEVGALIDACVNRFNGVAGQPRSFDPLDRLLNGQSYRLAHWRVASEEINYRRFFDVNQLAALRMEDPQVFDEVHRYAFELVHRGGPTGLRIDHVDGLCAPGDYLRRLQLRLKPDTTYDSDTTTARSTAEDSKGTEEETTTRTGSSSVSSASSVIGSFYIVVEKILGADEKL